jgi:hypothetical protein
MLQHAVLVQLGRFVMLLELLTSLTLAVLLEISVQNRLMLLYSVSPAHTVQQLAQGARKTASLVLQAFSAKQVLWFQLHAVQGLRAQLAVQMKRLVQLVSTALRRCPQTSLFHFLVPPGCSALKAVQHRRFVRRALAVRSRARTRWFVLKAHSAQPTLAMPLVQIVQRHANRVHLVHTAKLQMELNV